MTPRVDIPGLRAQGMFQYGSSISVADTAILFGVTVPPPNLLNDHIVMVRFDLEMLSVYGLLNDDLMTIGRKIVRQGEDYVVPTIESTLIHVDRYEDKASRSDAKARKLRRSFWEANPGYNNDRDRAREARNHARDNRRQGGQDEPPLR